jgi:hypothetical protein
MVSGLRSSAIAELGSQDSLRQGDQARARDRHLSPSSSCPAATQTRASASAQPGTACRSGCRRAGARIDRQWTSYGGGGEVVNSAAGYANGYKDLSLLRPPGPAPAQRRSGPSAVNSTATARRAPPPPAPAPPPCSISAASMSFTKGFDLLFAAGRSIYGQPETYTYLSALLDLGSQGRPPRGQGQIRPRQEFQYAQCSQSVPSLIGVFPAKLECQAQLAPKCGQTPEYQSLDW